MICHENPKASLLLTKCQRRACRKSRQVHGLIASACQLLLDALGLGHIPSEKNKL
jgi:hypothetical protein